MSGSDSSDRLTATTGADRAGQSTATLREGADVEAAARELQAEHSPSVVRTDREQLQCVRRGLAPEVVIVGRRGGWR